MTSDRAPERGSTEWTVFGSRSLYSSRWLELQMVDVEAPDGSRFEHHVVRMQRVAVSVVLNETESAILMIRRHRFINSTWGWEVPVGIVESDEDPAETARREFEEETGWRPRDLSSLLCFQPAIGIADSEHLVYVGQGADFVGSPADVTEADRVEWVPLDTIMRMVADGEIRDGATLVGVLHLLASRGGA